MVLRIVYNTMSIYTTLLKYEHFSIESLYAAAIGGCCKHCKPTVADLVRYIEYNAWIEGDTKRFLYATICIL